MKYRRVDSQDALMLVRSLGLLLNQAAVYGPVHNVTNAAISRVYQEVVEKLDEYRILEFTIQNNLICINGLSGNVDPVVSHNLFKRFSQLKISGVLFVHPLPAKEFERCIKILALPIADVIAASGVEELFKREGLESVAVVKVDYRRVEGEQAANESAAASTLQGTSTPSQGWGSGVIDLSDDLLGGGAGGSGEGDGLTPEEVVAQRRIERARQAEALAALLRSTAEALESHSDDNPKEQLGRVMGVLEQVKAALRDLTQGSRSAISSLAQSVDEDRMMVASIEAEATTRGYPLKLTREELLARYAELTQEIIQPLTVSTGVIEMLRKEQLGIMTQPQQEMLLLAQESIERVNDLVHYMTGVSGMPFSLNPDRSFLE